jgi:hypothetical protein
MTGAKVKAAEPGVICAQCGSAPPDSAGSKRVKAARRLPGTLTYMRRLRAQRWKPRRVASPVQRDDAFEDSASVFRARAAYRRTAATSELVWNRQTFIKEPNTGKRQARPNPTEEWVTQDVPELRIIGDALWNEVKARQQHVRLALTHDSAGIRSERARRPAYLLSNLLKCGACGGGSRRSASTITAVRTHATAAPVRTG